AIRSTYASALAASARCSVSRVVVIWPPGCARYLPFSAFSSCTCPVSTWQRSQHGSRPDLTEGGGNGGRQPPRRRRRQVGDHARSGPAFLLEGELHPQVAAALAVVDHRDRPCGAGPLLVVLGMVIEREIDGLLHDPLPSAPPASSWASALEPRLGWALERLSCPV